MGEKGRFDRALEPGAARIAVVEHRDPGRRGPEGRPERPAVDADSDVPSGAGNAGTSKDPPAHGVDRDEFLGRRVGDVHEIGARVDGGVPRRFESVELGANSSRNRVDQRYETVLGVRDDRRAPVDGLDAARAGSRPDPGDRLPRAELDQDDVTFQVGRHERHACSAEAAGERVRIDRERKR